MIRANPAFRIHDAIAQVIAIHDWRALGRLHPATLWKSFARWLTS